MTGVTNFTPEQRAESVDSTRNLGLDFQTKEEAEAGRLRMYARNRLDAWLREHYESGECVLRWSNIFSQWLPSRVGLTTAGELTVSESVAWRCVDELNSGRLRLTPPKRQR